MTNWVLRKNLSDINIHIEDIHICGDSLLENSIKDLGHFFVQIELKII